MAEYEIQQYDAGGGDYVGGEYQDDYDNLNLGADTGEQLVTELLELGAAAPRRPTPAKVVRRVVAAAPQPRRSAGDLPIPPTAFLASETRTIQLQPQRPFRMKRPMVPGSIAPYFVFLDIMAGQTSVFSAPGGAPAELYTEVAEEAELPGPPLGVGQVMILTVQNIDAGGPHTFRGVIKGY